MTDPIAITEEDAFHIIVRYLKEDRGKKGDYHSYGYDFYIPNVMHDHLATAHQIPFHEAESHFRSLSPHFYAAAWELCRRGVLRPGISEYGKQATADGASGNGYSLTPFGRTWIKESTQFDYVPIDPSRFAQLLAKYGTRFGAGFMERSQEAMRCYVANAHLACCVMCGAAAESVLLALAIQMKGNEVEILKMYEAQGGRGRVEKYVIGQQPPNIQNDFLVYSSILKYWRDTASHGKIANITGDEAHTSLALLLRLVQFANNRWDILTKSN